jgi:glycerate kinase
MRVLIAPDKFKGTLSAHEVCLAIEEGLRSKIPDIECVLFPLADGGEGTMEILTEYSKGHFVNLTVHDPFLRKIDSTYGISSDRKTAFIEMAGASGIRLLTDQEKDVMKASTFGTGEMIEDAIQKGATHIVIGIGGSATNDAAAGAANALGYEFLNDNDQAVKPVGGNLAEIKSIKTDRVNPSLTNVTFTAVCDVENPLTGKNGAAYVFGTQKGASPEQLQLLDDGLKNLANIIEKYLGVSINNIPGAGAGGGFGGGVIAFFNGTLKRGIDVVFDFTGFEEEVKKADVIITGEGKLDEQTLQGKVVAGVAVMAKQHSKKVLCIAGSNELSTEEIQKLGVAEVYAVLDYVNREEAFANAAQSIKRVAFDRIAKGMMN